MKESFAKTVWDTLHMVDVSSKVEKKGNLSYLSWAWAWGVLKEYYPESNYAFREPVDRLDGSCEIWVDLTVSEGESSLTHSMWLPVMDNRNNAMLKPDARKISDTRMRCLTKAIAMFGLGHYIYAGEDLPQGDLDEIRQGYSNEQKMRFHALVAEGNNLGLWTFRQGVGDEIYAALHNTFEAGEKVANKKRVAALEVGAAEELACLAADFGICIDANDSHGVNEFADYDLCIKQAIYGQLDHTQQHKLAEMKKEAV